LVERLQQRLDGTAIADPRAAQPPDPAKGLEASAPSTTAPEASVPSPSISPAQAKSTRQRSQYFEHQRKQDRSTSAVIRQCLVGAAGRLLGARQIAPDVRRLFRLQKDSYSDWDQFYEIPGRPLFRYRPVKS
jgi:hypothetical protein